MNTLREKAARMRQAAKKLDEAAEFLESTILTKEGDEQELLSRATIALSDLKREIDLHPTVHLGTGELFKETATYRNAANVLAVLEERAKA